MTAPAPLASRQSVLATKLSDASRPVLAWQMTFLFLALGAANLATVAIVALLSRLVPERYSKAEWPHDQTHLPPAAEFALYFHL